MGAISDWIANIILLILIATILELLLPNSSLERYVKMVIGLMLIAVIITPVLSIFSKDFDQMLRSVHFDQLVPSKTLENSIENKKSEIQASNRAYILEQMAVQMENQVEEELRKKYGLEIKAMDVELSSGAETSQEAEKIEKITVVLDESGQSGEDKTVPVVKEVKIDLSKKQNEQVKHNKTNTITYFLADKWGVYPNQIDLQSEGGDSISP
ncbi:stage III sporulation protein AF [Pseudalkalibacillus caeni]|uniref:Stage III sporulation protein AF n=1 Tax=Exobacillus caeni TaxID=2574798 RepID=A0A5R9F116_9BACL|nr:stage III sporulation protein AF [Pseudalkalibacillus caeni]TLS36369.1 stage III sporulation protein AF [Pseudalkalibacillus caeni]